LLDFAKKLLTIGGIKGGWDDALEKQLDLKDPGNQKLNEQAWNYLMIVMEGEVLREMDIYPLSESDGGHPSYQYGLVASPYISPTSEYPQLLALLHQTTLRKYNARQPNFRSGLHGPNNNIIK